VKSEDISGKEKRTSDDKINDFATSSSRRTLEKYRGVN
jgi:hypothetical protein